MDKIKGFFTAVKPQKDGDLADRLAYYYTVVLLTIFAFIIFGWSFFGTPIQCWFPAYYKGWWQEYALDYCYVQNTYFVKFTTGDNKPKNHWELEKQQNPLPTEPEDRKKLLIGYYQWVPFVLALMAMSFYAPVLLWRSMNGHSGVNVKVLFDHAANADNIKPDNRKSVAAKMCRFLDHSIAVTERLKRKMLFGRYIVSLYLFTKILTVANCIGQFFMLEHFLGLDENWWGIKVLKDITRGRQWQETGNFPRTTMCDYRVRELGNIHNHSVQCVLMINFLNEKIFLFLWFWFAMVAFISVLSLIYWLAAILYESSGRKIVISYLQRIDPDSAKNTRVQRMISKFLRDTLKTDGLFMLRLMMQNSSDLICSDLIEAMWNEYKQKHKDDFGPPNATAPNVKLAGDPGYHQGTMPAYGYPPLPSYDDVDLRKRGNESTL